MPGNPPASTGTTVTILGAGAMGSALATPLRQRGHSVRLWGTWLDDDVLDLVAAGAPHPRTDVHVAEGTQLFRSDELEAALTGSDLVFLAVASEGVDAVVRRAAPWLSTVGVLGLTSKGFLADPSGAIRLLPDAIRRHFSEAELAAPSIVAVGGPCKANEVAAGGPTATVYGCSDVDVARSVAALIQTDSYHVEPIADDLGLEVAAPLKNVFAIALGFADGLADATSHPWHNLKSAIFAQSVREMSIVARGIGGSIDTVYGLAGTGDLEVTGLSGRNKVYGSRIGAGQTAHDALETMVAEKQTVEGVPAAGLAVALAAQLFDDAESRLPLLHAVHRMISGAGDPLTELSAAALPPVVVAEARR
ncbi:NAD(P)H-dependent glycerol-3-phosphate dehydrogenase [Frondihabitans australicus]|uniref:Glycerol-3-phosphate dehydrogenase n=1 Tax=Frondihabitans australicus TaxID=386892 RepID=A0A495IMR8_9MICO|nr:NAD(P)-binding domain-containing protein [Frondihabitans australicus]RKR76425.1 glycerol-3-phosphate dehydrogenase (NAD(P)+) [Frondihabitans australicus]